MTELPAFVRSADSGATRRARARCRPCGCCALALALVVTIAGCGNGDDDEPDGSTPGLANPASEYCVEQGGEVEIVDEADGQVGYCLLPDGRRIEEWEFYRAETGATTVP